MTRASFGTPFAGGVLASTAAAQPGCVTSDDPAALIELNVLGRDVQRGCSVVVDLGGYSYVLNGNHGGRLPRERDPEWQQHTLSYLRQGTATMVIRYRVGAGLSPATARLIIHWPVLRRVSGDTLRVPRG